MFEKELATAFNNIFKVKKVSYSQPSESAEQQVLFVEIERARSSIRQKEQRSMVTGNAYMYGTNESLPFGFFDKALMQAGLDLTKDFFFHDKEVNTRRYGNIVQRGFSFVYFFSGQYDPKVGTITEVDFIFEEP